MAAVTPYSEEDIEEHVAAFRDHPGALTSALHYYRAAGRALLRQLAASALRGSADMSYGNTSTVIDKPVLVLWGE